MSAATSQEGRAQKSLGRNLSQEEQGRLMRSDCSFRHGWVVVAMTALLALTITVRADNTITNHRPAAAAATMTPAPSQSATASATEDIRDIRPPYHLPSGWRWLGWAAAVCSVAALGYGLWRWRHRLPGLRPRLPYELALEQLEAAREWLHPATAREFSIAVSVVVRNYIETRFATYAAHRTTDEFLHDCATHPDSPLAGYREALGDFLHHCDLAKFARWVLSADEMEAMLRSAGTFVRETGQASAAKAGAQSSRQAASAQPDHPGPVNAPGSSPQPLPAAPATTT